MKTRSVLLPLVLLVACGDDGGGDDGGSDSPDAAASACTLEGFDVLQESAERDDELGVLFYTAVAGEAPNIQRLSYDLYFPLGASDQPHEFTFTGESLADCHTCSTMRSECSTSSCINARAFLAQEGKAVITEVGGPGGRLVGRIEDAVFAEVTIEAGTLETTLVPNGQTWCIDEYSFDVPVVAP